MNIVPIQRLDALKDLASVKETSKTDNTVSFKNIFEEAIANVKNTEDDLAKEQYLFATGQTDNTHDITIAASKAQISVDLLVQLRDKALNAYNELIKLNL
ncbi:MAG: flagellar hook-basal body complex protein FliE [Lachnospiraceae bacterium]|nr:flagellar hook-basal body complex protein FliE [Lachnospiraceae bacterium]